MSAPDPSVVQDLVDHLFDELSDSRSRASDFSWGSFPQMAHDLALNVLVDEAAAELAEQYAYNKTMNERLSSDPRTHYSMGFVMSEDGLSLLLLEKGRPQFLKGKWVGIGGHVDEGETFEQAMARECFEEAGLEVPLSSWVLLKVVERPNAVIAMFAARHDLSHAHTKTDEQVKVFSWDEVDQLQTSDGTQEVMDLVRAMASIAQAAPQSSKPLKAHL